MSKRRPEYVAFEKMFKRGVPQPVEEPLFDAFELQVLHYLAVAVFVSLLIAIGATFVLYLFRVELFVLIEQVNNEYLR